MKNFVDMYNRLDRILACDGQTYRKTDILPRHSPLCAYASRGKNHSQSILKFEFESDSIAAVVVCSIVTTVA